MQRCHDCDCYKLNPLARLYATMCTYFVAIVHSDATDRKILLTKSLFFIYLHDAEMEKCNFKGIELHYSGNIFQECLAKGSKPNVHKLFEYIKL